jgi:hypothetical protein
MVYSGYTNSDLCCLSRVYILVICMRYASFPLPPLTDSDNPIRCRCHRMLVEMMIIYERIIEALTAEDEKEIRNRPAKSKRVVTKKYNKYRKDLTKK